MPDELPYHIPTAFLKGKSVKVAREVRQAHAWHEEWSRAAQELVGQTVKILDTDPIRGFYCERRGLVRAWLPSPALQAPDQNNDVVVIVPSIPEGE